MGASASIVVCTRERARELTDTLQSLIEQSVARDLQWEILVVHNASQDETASVARRIAEVSPVELRYLLEPELGLSIARNRGWREARGEIVAYIDDDTIADPRWLQEIVDSYASARIVGAGGRLVPLLDPEAAERLDPGWLDLYSYDLGDVTRDVELLSGASMSFRRDLLEQIGGFDIQLGRIGPCTLAGDEQDICRAIRRRPGRLRIVYNPRIVAYHKTPSHDLSDENLIKRYYCGGISNAILDRKEKPARRAFELTLRGTKLGVWLARGLLRLLRGGSRSAQQTARLQEFVGYYKESVLGSTAACKDCPMFPQRRPRLEARAASLQSAAVK